MVVPEHLAQEEGGKGHIYHDPLEETEAGLSSQLWAAGGQAPVESTCSLWLSLESSQKASLVIGAGLGATSAERHSWLTLWVPMDGNQKLRENSLKPKEVLTTVTL